jgi:hypothetical protein
VLLLCREREGVIVHTAAGVLKDLFGRADKAPSLCQCLRGGAHTVGLQLAREYAEVTRTLEAAGPAI